MSSLSSQVRSKLYKDMANDFHGRRKNSNQNRQMFGQGGYMGQTRREHEEVSYVSFIQPPDRALILNLINTHIRLG